MIDGERSGGTRFNTEKPGFFWAVPLMGLRLIARVTSHGAKKYAPLDWAEGQSFSTLLDCITRHLLEVLTRGPWARDADSGLFHMAHVGWNVLCILHFMETERHDLDDVSEWRGVTTAQRNERDMDILREGDTIEVSGPEITYEAVDGQDDDVYVGPIQWQGPHPLPEKVNPAPLGNASPTEPVYGGKHFAPTGLKGFVHEANEMLSRFEETAIRRARREADRVIHYPPTHEDMDEALRRKIIKQQMDDTEATAGP